MIFLITLILFAALCPNNQVNPVIWPDLADPDYGTCAAEAIRNHHKTSLDLYNKLIKEGVCREQARGVLPQNLYTEYYGTTNLNNLIKFSGTGIILSFAPLPCCTCISKSNPLMFSILRFNSSSLLTPE